MNLLVQVVIAVILLALYIWAIGLVPMPPILNTILIVLGVVVFGVWLAGVAGFIAPGTFRRGSR